MAKLIFQFDDKLSKTVKRIAIEKGTSETEVLQRAIATYDALEKEIAQNRQITVTENNKVIKELIVP